jgi:hypothetical protein
LQTSQHHSIWTLLKLLPFWIAILIPPIIERTVLGSKPKYGDGIEWKLKQVIGFLRDA